MSQGSDARTAPTRPHGAGAVAIAGGTFTLGAGALYPEEQPSRRLTVADFAIEAIPVTNAQFARFVQETGYVTSAEQPTGVDGVEPGSLVFRATDAPVDLRDWRQWWRWVDGACWHAPRGPGSDLSGRAEHPVTHVSYADAAAYADWAGMRLPTEYEHEYAACGGAVPAPYAWGAERDPGGRFMANTWRGRFPYLNTAEDGWETTSPVGAFPANGYGLFDMIGNVWEWTTTRYLPSHAGSEPACACSPAPDPSGETLRVLKGGSHLCAPEYCLRYRPAARSAQAENTSSSHIGFRCASTGGQENPTSRRPESGRDATAPHTRRTEPTHRR